MSNTVTDVSKLDGTERTQEYVDRLTGILGQMQSAPPLSVKITFATLSVLHGVVKHAIFAGVYR